jgi:hypothetical protein
MVLRRQVTSKVDSGQNAANAAAGTTVAAQIVRPDNSLQTTSLRRS